MRVWVIGLDGASWNLINALLDEGELPTFARLKREAAWGPLQTLRPTVSPVIWTTMATGLPVQAHGILGWQKGSQLITSNWRAGVPFWEIADRRGHSVAVVNWWATYPVTELRNGLMVSDRFRNAVHDFSLGQQRGMVHPSERGAEFLGLLKRITPQITHMTIKRFGFPWYAKVRKERPDILTRPNAPKRLKSLHGYVRQDLWVEAMVNEILSRKTPDLLAVLFRIVDVYGHLVLTFAPNPQPFLVAHEQLSTERLKTAGDDPAVRQKIHTLDRAFAHLMRPALHLADHFLSEILAYREPNTYVIVLSDHGFAWRGDALYDHRDIPGLPNVDGIFVILGPDVIPGRLPKPISVYHIAPLVVGLLEGPLSREFKAQFPVWLFRDTRSWRQKIHYVPAYRRWHREVVVDEKELRKTEQKVREDLRTLGYIQ